MSSPFIAEITLFAGNFAPRSWAFCSGQILPIAQNTALFSLLGTTYGGNGQTTFALPDLQGRLPMHAGQGPGLSPRDLGEQTGTETVTLTTPEMPNHSHPIQTGAAGVATHPNPIGRYPAQSPAGTPYASAGAAQMASGSNTNNIGVSGGSQPHNNLMPSLCVNFIIALQGVFPSRN